MGMVQKQGQWVPSELQPRDVERRLCTCEQLLQQQNRKGFLHRIVTGDEKWIRYDNPKRRKSWGEPGHASTSTAKPNIHGKKLMLCIWWDQLGVLYYELLQPQETITGERYQQQLKQLSRALKLKRPQYANRHDKVIFQHDTLGHMLHKSSRTLWRRLNGRSYPTRRIHQTLLLPTTTCFGRWLMAWPTSTSLRTTKPKIGSILGSPPKTWHFFAAESVVCLHDGEWS